jgi:hypothetical protein
VVITSVIDEDNSHNTIKIIWVLTVNSNTGFVLEGLTDSTLEDILVELGKK